MTLRRRDFITLLGGAAAAWPIAARAQQRALPVIGVLSAGTPEAGVSRLAVFRQALEEAGFVDGRNVTLEYRYANDDTGRLPELAADLVRRGAAVMRTGGTLATLAAKAASSTIPVVFLIGNDPVKVGLVNALNRPGGNVTGITEIAIGLTPKRLELLHELVPQATKVAALVDPTDPSVGDTRAELQKAARMLGLELLILDTASERDFEPAFAAMVEWRAGGLVLNDEVLFNNHPAELVALAANHAIPTIYAFREFATDGGLMSYASNLIEASRLTGVYAARILKGEKPSDLPIMQPAKFEMVINLKTAKALGLTIPLTLQYAADEVIE